MIPLAAITAWSVDHEWPTVEQVEQDLLLSRAICEIADHPYLRDELTFRGGTALHKLHLPAAYRYSEDLDYVRSTSGGIGDLTRALTDLGEDLGFIVRTRISEHPKVYWRTTAESGVPLRIKIEVNTHERSPVLPITSMTHSVDSTWWRGTAEVRTFQRSELMATKIRALYQRSKGRDLFDLWLALTELQIAPEDLLATFAPYRPAGLTASKAVANLRAKVADGAFLADLDPLVVRTPPDYTVESAAATISQALLVRLDE